MNEAISIMAKGLGARSANVLDAVVEAFILNGQPVGSAAIAAEFPERLSPATIRNVMAELEATGYLYQPHTSAGRVPTEAGYRRYVRQLVSRGRLQPMDAAAIKRQLRRRETDLEALLQRACSLLSEMSHQVAVLLAPPPADTAIRHVQFVPMGNRRVLVVFVTEGGMLHTRALELDSEPSDRALAAAARFLTERFRGRTLGQLRSRAQKLAAVARLTPRERLALLLGIRALDTAIDHGEVLVEGTARLLDSPDLAAAGTLQSLLLAMEERRGLAQLLNECSVGHHPRVMIGGERFPEALEGCALIAAGYRSGPRALGVLGILGPARMEYARAIPVVDAMARATSEVLTELCG